MSPGPVHTASIGPNASVRVPGATAPDANGLLSPHIQALRDSGVLLTDYNVFKFCLFAGLDP